MAAFALLLMALAAAPALGSDGADPAPAAGVEQLPSPDEFAHALAVAEANEARERAAREEWLESPVAERQREGSRDAFTGFSGDQSRVLLERTFAERLDALDSDPARALGDLEVEAVLGPNVARVANGAGG